MHYHKYASGYNNNNNNNNNNNKYSENVSVQYHTRFFYKVRGLYLR